MLVLSTLFVYIQLKDFNYINYDDDLLVFTNENIKFGLTFDSIIWAFTDATFLSNYWQPLTWISHIIDFNIFEMDAGGHHLTSLFFHLINILLVLIFLNKVTNNFWISSFVALFFALHPIHVESVAWISERKDVLSTFFLLMTLNLYLQYAKKRIIIFYYFTYLFFILGLMSKPMVITLPFLLLMLDIWPLKRIL